MKKLTVLAALMLLVSLSTVFAVRTHQRNLSQLTAQNIEALSDGEIRSIVDILTGYYPGTESHPEDCEYLAEISGTPGATVIINGVPVTFDVKGKAKIKIEGNEVLCYGNGQGCTSPTFYQLKSITPVFKALGFFEMKFEHYRFLCAGMGSVGSPTYHRWLQQPVLVSCRYPYLLSHLGR